MNGNSIKAGLLCISLMILGGSMSACAMGDKTSWKEEVLLHDGSKLVVERYYNLGSSPGTGITLLDQTITFTLPGSSNPISWKTEYRQDLPEPNSLGALLLDVVGGVPYLATSPAGCIAYNKWGRPNPPYILFKYTHDAWQQIPLQAFPSELVQANLMGPSVTELLKPYYTVEAAQAQRQNGNVSAESRTILREAVVKGALGTDGSSVNCEWMIPYGKGGWLGLDWFSDQPSYEACFNYCERKGVHPQNCPCATLFKGK